MRHDVCVYTKYFAFQALVTLFVLATRDGWVTVMHYGVDAVGVDYQVKLK